MSPSIRRKIVIFVAVSLLVGVLFYVEHSSVRVVKRLVASAGFIDSEHTLVGMTDIRSIDHVRGDADSPVALIEYSDFTCLMCAAMQGNFDRIAREQKVRVVSRHLYPYPEGPGFERAVAAECVAKELGEEAYFSFSRYLYGLQPAGNDDSDLLLEHAVSLGVDATVFQGCIDNDRSVRDRIYQESEEGWWLGARGTPYVVVVYDDMPIGISYANEYQRFVERVRLLVARARMGRD